MTSEQLVSEPEVSLEHDEAVDDFSLKAEAWLQENVPARWRDGHGTLSNEESDSIRRDWDRILYRGGYAGLGLPREFGGQGLGLAEEVAFHVLAGKAQAPD